MVHNVESTNHFQLLTLSSALTRYPGGWRPTLIWTHPSNKRLLTKCWNNPMWPHVCSVLRFIPSQNKHKNRPVSSAGQSVVLITPRSWVQSPYWPVKLCLKVTWSWMGLSHSLSADKAFSFLHYCLATASHLVKDPLTPGANWHKSLLTSNDPVTKTTPGINDRTATSLLPEEALGKTVNYLLHKIDRGHIIFISKSKASGAPVA